MKFISCNMGYYSFIRRSLQSKVELIEGSVSSASEHMLLGTSGGGPTTPGSGSLSLNSFGGDPDHSIVGDG